MGSLSQPRFRAKQIYQWLHGHHVRSFADMSNLPLSLRTQLAERFQLASGKIIDTQISRDGTRKYVIEYDDRSRVETVAMPSDPNGSSDSNNPSDPNGFGGSNGSDGQAPNRATNKMPNRAQNKRLSVCFSTQVGCPMNCSFCATGKEGFSRNLTTQEIVDQVILVQNDINMKATSLVAMGQGEPFLNYDNTLQALRECNSPDSLHIGARHITVSTCGITSGIEQLSHEPEQFTLAVSLHSAEQDIRDKLMPNVSRETLTKLKASLLAYIALTNRRVTLEYAMIKGLNDTEQALSSLLFFCQGLLCHINLIPLNAIEESEYQPSDAHTMNSWVRSLTNSHIETTIRNSRGADINGACGQLKNSLSN